MHIGKKIRMLRRMKGYTQDELAEKINKTRALVSHIEQTGKINFYTQKEILKVFDMSADELESFNPEHSSRLFAREAGVPYGKNELVLLKQQLESCQKEIEMLKEIVISQKKIIEMYERPKSSKRKR